MSTNHQTLIDIFIKYQRNNFHQFLLNLTFYYNNFRLYLLEKSNEWFLSFTIIISIITLFIILSIILESNLLLKLFLSIYSFNKYLFLKIKKTFFQSTSSSSLLNCLLNSPSSIQQCFLNEFLYSLNQEFLYKKVTKYFYFIIPYNLLLYYAHIIIIF